MRHHLLSLLLVITAAIACSASSVTAKANAQESSTRPRRAPEQQVSSEARYVVQLGASFSTAEKANELTSRLQRKYPTAHTESPSGSETLYRVRIGPYNTRESAQQTAIELESQGFKGVTIFPWRQSSRKPASEQAEKPVSTTPIPEPEDAMRRVLADLSTQIGLLADELRKLRGDTERNSSMIELLLNEDRLAKVEDRIQDASNNKAQLDAREQEIQRRMRNIPAEAALRGGRREEVEAALRSEFQRALDDTRAQQAGNQQRLAELVDQSARLRTRLESLRKRLEQTDEKTDKEKE